MPFPLARRGPPVAVFGGIMARKAARFQQANGPRRQHPWHHSGKATLPASMESTPVHPFRIYTMQVDGVTKEMAFPHPEGISGTALDLLLHHEFTAWLDSEFPGHEEGGRIA